MKASTLRNDPLAVLNNPNPRDGDVAWRWRFSAERGAWIPIESPQMPASAVLAAKRADIAEQPAAQINGFVSHNTETPSQILGFVRCQRQNVVWNGHDFFFSGGKLRCRNCGHEV